MVENHNAGYADGRVTEPGNSISKCLLFIFPNIDGANCAARNLVQLKNKRKENLNLRRTIKIEKCNKIALIDFSRVQRIQLPA